MLDIILQILSVLGIILLVLLCIIIVVLLLVLFFPVSYKISGEKDAEAFSLSARANWLFGLLRVRYAYPEPGRLTVKLLWIMLYDSADHEEKATDKEKAEDKNKPKDKAKEKSKEKTKEKTKDKTKEKLKNRTKDKSKKRTETISEKQSEDRSDITIQAAAGNMENAGNIDNTGSIENAGNIGNTDSTDSAGNANNTEESQSADFFRKEQSQEASGNRKEEDDGQDSDWVSEKIEKIKFTIRSVYDKIKKIWDNITYYVSLLQEEETHLLFSHVMKRVGRILRNIRPRKLMVNILFGTGAPDTTGYAFGVYCMFSPVLGRGVTVMPDFERVVLEGDFDAAGTITSAVLFWHLLKVIMDKKFRRFLDILKTGREPADTFKTETREENTKINSKNKRKGLKERKKNNHKS